MTRWLRHKIVLGIVGALVLGIIGLGNVLAAASTTTFPIARSAAAMTNNCILNARAKGAITPLGPVEKMTITVQGLPANTNFDVFLLQVPNSPFGIGWYVGDFTTDATGYASQSFLSRFSIETFAFASGTASAPVVFTDTPFPDASSNPPFNPIHTYHVGLWFDSPTEAQNAGCPNTETAFNGPHTAGIQAMSTNTFADDQGPLRQVQ